jgi:cell division protein FtsB
MSVTQAQVKLAFAKAAKAKGKVDSLEKDREATMARIANLQRNLAKLKREAHYQKLMEEGKFVPTVPCNYSPCTNPKCTFLHE